MIRWPCLGTGVILVLKTFPSTSSTILAFGLSTFLASDSNTARAFSFCGIRDLIRQASEPRLWAHEPLLSQHPPWPHLHPQRSHKLPQTRAGEAQAREKLRRVEGLASQLIVEENIAISSILWSLLVLDSPNSRHSHRPTCLTRTFFIAWIKKLKSSGCFDEESRDVHKYS